MKIEIELSMQELSLLNELIQEWRMHRQYSMEEINIINGIVKKIYGCSSGRG